jgi:hypothetical protein
VTDNGERRTDHALRRRIDKLLGRVHDARAEIVERGLDAVRAEADRHGTGQGQPKLPPDADATGRV